MITIEQNQVVVYKTSGEKKIGIVEGILSDKFIIFTTTKRKLKLPLPKIFAAFTTEFQSKNYSEDERVKYLKSIEKKALDLVSSINLEEIYEVVCDDDNGLNAMEMAELYFPKPLSPEQILALIYALDKNTIFFKEKYQTLYPKSRKQVDDALKLIETTRLNEIKRLEIKETAIQWLKEFIQSRSVDQSNAEEETITLDLDPQDKPEIPTEVHKYLDPLKKYCIFPDEPIIKNLAISTLEELKERTNWKNQNTNYQTAFALLVILGIFTKDENLTLYRYNIPNSFSKEALEEADGIVQKDFLQELNQHKDLTHLLTFTIDDEKTKDMDDAISVQPLDNNQTRVYVHISDVSSFIKQSTPLDLEALDRGMTVYLPVGKISMFPDILSENLISLIPDKIRPALTFEYLFNNEGEILDKVIYPAKIIVKHKLSYNTAMEIFDQNQNNPLNQHLHLLYNIAKKLLFTRMMNGAIQLDNLELKVLVHNEEEIEIKKVNTNLPSYVIIKEFMILCNQSASEFCIVNQIPVFYFSQLPPDEMPEYPREKPISRYLRYEILRKFKKSEIVLSPASHFALGIPFYTQATSPIRRYHDLIIHRQIKAFLSNEPPPYSLEEIQILAATAEKAARNTMLAEKETNRYWILKYLRQHKKETTKAIILRKTMNGYLVELENTFVQAPIITSASLNPGQTVEVIIENANPRMDSLNIRLLK